MRFLQIIFGGLLAVWSLALGGQIMVDTPENVRSRRGVAAMLAGLAGTLLMGGGSYLLLKKALRD